MQNTEIELVVCRQMRHTGNEGLLQRTVVRPAGKDFVDGGVVDGIGAIRGLRDRQALPLHAGVEHPQDQIEDTVIAEFTLGTTFRHGEVRQDKRSELYFRQLDGNGRGRGLFGWYGHDQMALFEDMRDRS